MNGTLPIENSPPPASPIGGESSAAALYQSFLMILASEIGDKTFLIAAILSMRHPRLVVFLGAFSSLAVMSVLSAGIGELLPSLFLPRKWTQLGAAILFFWFGIKMGREGWEMEGGSAKLQEEIKEVEEEIADTAEDAVPLQNLESGTTRNGHATTDEAGFVTPAKTSFSISQKPREIGSKIKDGAHNFASLFLGPVFVQAFILTFLGEWGDRSQIATIALAAAHNIYAVTMGTLIGHSICTAVAVIGGRWLSTQISIKHVTLGGAFLFILFGLIYLHESLLA